MPFDIKSCDLEEVFQFKEMYEYMCRTKIHPNKDYQKTFEEQRSEIEPNNYPKAILMIRHKENKQLYIVHMCVSKKLKETSKKW